MITNKWVFRDDYSTTILHRDREPEQLSRWLNPALGGREAECALVHGSSGVGKSSSTQFLLRQLNQEEPVEVSTIECSEITCHGVVYQVAVRHRAGTAVQHNSPTEWKVLTGRQKDISS